MVLVTAQKDELGEKSIIVGNLTRMKTIVQLLDNARQISEFAGYYTYVGNYKGEKVSVVFHGIGIPSLTLITHDLFNLGVKEIIRFGSATGLKDVKPGEIVIPIGYSYNMGGTFMQYFGGDLMSYALTADYELMNKLVRSLSQSQKVRVGNVFTSDALLAQTRDYLKKLSSRNHLAVELEGAGLYFLANLLGFKAVSVHLIYRNALTEETLSQDEITKKEKEIAEIILNSI
ncbi:purine nucleoside phosphorylase [Candidatus Acidianus copahuensis]|uniref:Purine nucleoside phosphorylase n=1 Tax=Candidatus Acidianus copahuensis TaxID=1160895 RepID=A0A031LTU4_9CREN|nr:purine-nucleoside phosphorylase [Candidatus Acidianus copahuensis]EZQ10553.1 purine nucleoside phosphorylase [Candidatus Acidianus copahuensis]